MNDQRSLYEQLITLHALANTHGLYDAADWLRRQGKAMEEPSVEGEFPRLKGESWDDYTYRYNDYLERTFERP